MSQENVEISRGAFEAWRRGDFDAFFQAVDDDVVVRPMEGWPDFSRPFHGKDAFRSFMEAYVEVVGHDTVIENEIDAGAVVVFRVRAHFSGERSGIEGDQRFTVVITVRNGKAVLIEYFWDHGEALRAAGLQE